MKYFVILLVLTGAIGTAFAESQVVLTPFDVYLSADDFTAQGPNHNILALDRGESATLTVYVKNNDDKPHQITLKDPRGPNLGLFETFRFESEQLTVMPHQTNSTQLYLTISKDTDTHSSFITFLGQSTTFGMRGLGFFVVVDREIDDYVDRSLRSGLPGGAFPHLNTEISETDAEKLIGSGFGIPKYLPSGYEFRGMDGSEDQQRFVYSPANINTETTGFSEFWNDEGLLIIYNADGPNVNNTKSLPIKVAQDEGQQIMINGMMGDATKKETRAVVESDITYDVPASVTFFDDVKKKSAHLRANMQLDELFKIASSIPVYDKPYFTAEESTAQQQGQADYSPPRLSDIAPLKQFKSGISVEEIQCGESLTLVVKYDGSPACVKPQTAEKLTERGWAIPLIIVEENNPRDTVPLDLDAAHAIDANNKFALNFYSQVNGNSENIFFSPWSISTAFAILQEGARGNTSEQIREVFGFSADSSQRQSGFKTINENLNASDDRYLFSVANSLWLAHGFSPYPEFVAVAKNNYESHVQEIDFQKDGVSIINAWVDEKTQKKIPELFVPGSLDSAVFAIANAIYFKGTWDNQFDPEKTQNAEFWRTGDSAVSVPMMYMSQSKHQIAFLDEVQLLELPYDGGKLSMLVLLPNEIDELNKLESVISVEKIKEWKKELRERSVVVIMPKFKLEADYELIPELQSMGISDLFGSSSDLGGMSDLPLFVGEAVHKAVIEVNEEGTEAAAATGIGGFMSGPPEFIVDHPFMFIIQDNETGNILFMGRVTDPIK